MHLYRVFRVDRNGLDMVDTNKMLEIHQDLIRDPRYPHRDIVDKLFQVLGFKSQFDGNYTPEYSLTRSEIKILYSEYGVKSLVWKLIKGI